jgi:hypothetical protein
MLKSTKAFLLAGASALAILTCAAEANAETFTVPGMFSFIASVSGEYAVELLGASGGNASGLGVGVGGLGAEVSGDIFLTAGEDLTLFVGGQGGSAILSGGGGGGSGLILGGGPGLAGTSGGTGGGAGGAGGANGNGGGGGTHYGGGGGAGVNAGAAGYGGDGADVFASGFGGKFPIGGAGSGDVGGGSGGYGGGGYFSRTQYGGGGGGSGFSGGGGGGGDPAPGDNGGGGGGGSYLASLFTDQVLTAGVNSGDGSISIAVVPEPSTWAMMATGFAGLGFLAHMRKRKLTAV